MKRLWGLALVLPLCLAMGVGCPGKTDSGGGASGASGASGGGESAHFDASNPDHMYAVYAAYQVDATAEKALRTKVLQKYGQIKSDGVTPNMEEMNKYNAALTKYTTEHAADWTKWTSANQGKWKEYLTGKGEG